MLLSASRLPCSSLSVAIQLGNTRDGPGCAGSEPQGGESRVTTEGYRLQCWYLHDQITLQLKVVVVKKNNFGKLTNFILSKEIIKVHFLFYFQIIVMFQVIMHQHSAVLFVVNSQWKQNQFWNMPTLESKHKKESTTTLKDFCKLAFCSRLGLTMYF